MTRVNRHARIVICGPISRYGTAARGQAGRSGDGAA